MGRDFWLKPGPNVQVRNEFDLRPYKQAEKKHSSGCISDRLCKLISWLLLLYNIWGCETKKATLQIKNTK